MCLVKNNGKSHPPGDSCAKRPWSTDIFLPNQLYRHLGFSSVWLLKERFARLGLHRTEIEHIWGKGIYILPKEEREWPKTSSCYVEEQNWESSYEQPRASGTILMPFLRSHWHLVQGDLCLSIILVPVSAPCIPTTLFSFSSLHLSLSTKGGCNIPSDVKSEAQTIRGTCNGYMGDCVTHYPTLSSF